MAGRLHVSFAGSRDTNGNRQFRELHPVGKERMAPVNFMNFIRSGPPHLNPGPSPSIAPAFPFMVIPGGVRGTMFDFQPLETCK